MAEKRLTPADVAQLIAENTGLTLEEVKSVLTAQTGLAYSEANKGFPIPGVGVFTIVERPPRQLVMPFGPQKGKVKMIPASRKLAFRFSRLAKEMTFLENKGATPDLFKPVVLPEFRFSSDATELSDPSMFLSDLGTPFVDAGDNDKQLPTIVFRLPDLDLPSGRMIAGDILFGGGKPFARSVPTGRHPLGLVVAQIGSDERVALAVVRFSTERIVKWEMARFEGQETAEIEQGKLIGYGVDSGTGSIGDASVQPLLAILNEEDIAFADQIADEMQKVHKNTRRWTHIQTTNGSLAVFSSGYGDGLYASYFGLDDSGNPAALVTDFNVINWGPVRGKSAEAPARAFGWKTARLPRPKKDSADGAEAD